MPFDRHAAMARVGPPFATLGQRLGVLLPDQSAERGDGSDALAILWCSMRAEGARKYAALLSVPGSRQTDAARK